MPDVVNADVYAVQMSFFEPPLHEFFSAYRGVDPYGTGTPIFMKGTSMVMSPSQNFRSDVF